MPKTCLTTPLSTLIGLITTMLPNTMPPSAMNSLTWNKPPMALHIMPPVPAPAPAAMAKPSDTPPKIITNPTIANIRFLLVCLTYTRSRLFRYERNEMTASVLIWHTRDSLTLSSSAMSFILSPS